jgi:hypothetical protein
MPTQISGQTTHRGRIARGARAVLFSTIAIVAGSGQVRADACTVPDAALASELMERWNGALKTQHPDRVTRLFATDGALLGFASPVARASYMPIRDYYLYFLQFEPQVKVSHRQLETGCNFLIDAGSYAWTLKSRATGAVETREARYRFTYEFVGGAWRIAQLDETLVGAPTVAGFAVPPPLTPRVVFLDGASGTAVAGFLKRAERAPPALPLASSAAPLPPKGRSNLGRAPAAKTDLKTETKSETKTGPAPARGDDALGVDALYAR